MTEQHKPKRVRSPSYPSIDLESAVEKLKVMYRFTHKTPVLISVMLPHWDFESGKSANGMKVVAAMKSYGIIDDTGQKKDRKIHITDSGFRILNLVEDSPERKKLIQDAALSPDIYQYLWNTFEVLPQFDSIKSHLVVEKKFNEGAVKGFLDDYLSTIEYAKLSKNDKLNGDENPEVEVKVGDYIQWESMGVLQFPIPAKVCEINEEGFVFVDGHAAGMPIDEVEVVEPPEQHGSGQLLPPANPVVGAVMKQDTFNVDEGQIVIQYPIGMSEASFEDFTDWLSLQHRKIGRTADGAKKPSMSVIKSNAEVKTD